MTGVHRRCLKRCSAAESDTDTFRLSSGGPAITSVLGPSPEYGSDLVAGVCHDRRFGVTIIAKSFGISFSRTPDCVPPLQQRWPSVQLAIISHWVSPGQVLHCRRPVAVVESSSSSCQIRRSSVAPRAGVGTASSRQMVLRPLPGDTARRLCCCRGRRGMAVTGRNPTRGCRTDSSKVTEFRQLLGVGRR